MSDAAPVWFIIIVLAVLAVVIVRERRRIAAERALPPAPIVGVVETPGPNHILHLLLTVLTCGLWVPIWVLVALNAKREIHAVDAYGRIVERESVTPTTVQAPRPVTEKQQTKKCPDCAETILGDANVCKHCGYRFAPPAAPPSTPSPAPKPPIVQSTWPKPAPQLDERAVSSWAASADAQTAAEAVSEEAQARAEAARARANELRRPAEESKDRKPPGKHTGHSDA